MGFPFNLRSTGGFSIYLYNNLIGLTTTKQKCNATSSTVAEVLAVLDSVKEIVWVSDLLRNIGMVWDETLLYCDSQPAINQCKHPKTLGTMKTHSVGLDRHSKKKTFGCVTFR